MDLHCSMTGWQSFLLFSPLPRSTTTLFICPKLQAVTLSLHCHFHTETVTWQCIKADLQLHFESCWTRWTLRGSPETSKLLLFTTRKAPCMFEESFFPFFFLFLCLQLCFSVSVATTQTHAPKTLTSDIFPCAIGRFFLLKAEVGSLSLRCGTPALLHVLSCSGKYKLTL